MRRKWLIAAISAVTAVAAIYGALVLFARPAPGHAFFANEEPRTQVIAHRGGMGLRPENTLAAFAHAVESGADVLEMDVQPTADGAIVCIHDPMVDRTTGGKGRVDSLKLSELQKLDAGYRWSNDGGRTFPFRGQGIRIPALAEVFARFPATRMIVEMKHGGAVLAAPLCALIRSHGMTEKALVASLDEPAVVAFRQTCPEVATVMSGSEARMFYFFQLLRLEAAYSPPAPALVIPDRLRGETLATRNLVEAAHRSGLKAHIWTINNEARMRELAKIGVDGIITDHPDRLRDLLPRAALPR